MLLSKYWCRPLKFPGWNVYGGLASLFPGLGLCGQFLTLDTMPRTSKPFLETPILLKTSFSCDVSKHREAIRSIFPLPTENPNSHKKETWTAIKILFTYLFIFKFQTSMYCTLGVFLSVNLCHPLSSHPFSPLSLDSFTSPRKSRMYFWLYIVIYHHIPCRNHIWKETRAVCLSETGLAHLIWKSPTGSFYLQTTYWVCLL